MFKITLSPSFKVCWFFYGVNLSSFFCCHEITCTEDLYPASRPDVPRLDLDMSRSQKWSTESDAYITVLKTFKNYHSYHTNNIIRRFILNSTGTSSSCCIFFVTLELSLRNASLPTTLRKFEKLSTYITSSIKVGKLCNFSSSNKRNVKLKLMSFSHDEKLYCALIEMMRCTVILRNN